MMGSRRVMIAGAVGGALGAFMLVLPLALSAVIAEDRSWSRGQWLLATLFVAVSAVVIACIARLAARRELQKAQKRATNLSDGG